MSGKRLGLACITASLCITTAAAVAGPATGQINLVNDPDFDTEKGDGTNDSQYNPDTAYWGGPARIGITSFDRYSNAPNAVGISYTDDGDEFTDIGNINGGTNSLRGLASVVWSDKTETYGGASQNTFGGNGKRPIGFTQAPNGGTPWGQVVDTDTSIAPGLEARFPSLAVNNDAASPYYGYWSLAYTVETSPTVTELRYQSATPAGAAWSNPIKINGDDCPRVGSGKIALAGDLIYAAYTCRSNDTYTPMVSRSAMGTNDWVVISTGLPTNVTYSGTVNTDCDEPVERTYAGNIGAFDTMDITYSPTRDMLFTTFTSRGNGADRSNIEIYGAIEQDGLSWNRYASLPGDAGSTYAFPAVGVNDVQGETHLWYTGLQVNPGGTTYDIKTFTTTNFTDWTRLGFKPRYQVPKLLPNEDTAVGDCYFGHRFFALDAMGDDVGLTYVGTGLDKGQLGAGGDVDPNIFFVALQAPVETSLTMTIKKTDAKIKASGKIDPVVPGDAEVTLFKKKDGSFKEVASKSAAFGNDGKYSASFNRPAKGNCRVVAEFPGDNTFGADEVTKTFSCKA